MHPAYSVILFTTASGLGYGLLALLGLYGLAGLAPESRWFGLVALGIALGSVTLGLLASTFHLGHPERAWRAFSQWRSSWLSREGVAAVVTYVPACAFALGWVVWEKPGGLFGLFGLLAAILAAATVYCTSMIYASIRAVPRWNNRWVPLNYLSLALMTGAVWFDALLRIFGAARPETPVLAAGAILVAWVLKIAYWREIDQARPVATSGSATGLWPQGEVKLLDAPHTADNYLQKEMGFQIARKHARKLRRIATIFAFVLPLILVLGALPLPAGLGALLAVLAALSVTVGVVVERWLFFAEAKHAVTLYYGAKAV